MPRTAAPCLAQTSHRPASHPVAHATTHGMTYRDQQSARQTSPKPRRSMPTLPAGRGDGIGPTACSRSSSYGRGRQHLGQALTLVHELPGSDHRAARGRGVLVRRHVTGGRLRALGSGITSTRAADSIGRKRAEGILRICFGDHHQRGCGEHRFAVEAHAVARGAGAAELVEQASAGREVCGRAAISRCAGGARRRRSCRRPRLVAADEIGHVGKAAGPQQAGRDR
jgi:hypothetical protein